MRTSSDGSSAGVRQGPNWRRAARLPLLALAIVFAFTNTSWAQLDTPNQVDDNTPDLELWKNRPYDLLILRNAENPDGERYTIDVALRIESGWIEKNVTPQPEVYIGRRGIPPLRELIRSMKYRIKLLDDPDEYDWECNGKDIYKFFFFEDQLITECKRMLRLKKYDNAHPYLTTLYDLSPKWPGLLPTRIVLHRDEADVLLGASDFARAFSSLTEERRLREELATTKEKMDESDVGIAPIEDRIEELTDRWIFRATSDGNYAEGRRVIARREDQNVNSPICKKWRAEYANRIVDAVKDATTYENQKDYRRAVLAYELAVNIAPDSKVAREAIEGFYQRNGSIRVAVENLSSYQRGLYAWTPGDWRCAELIHLPIVPFSAQQSGDRVSSNIIEKIDRSPTNEFCQLVLRPGQRWQHDGKPVMVSDLQRYFFEICQPTSEFYHPGFARLVSSLSVDVPDLMNIGFDRPQFQPWVWLQTPFVRPGTSGKTGAKVTGLGPFEIFEARPQETIFLANKYFIEQGKPKIKQVLETRIPKSAERLKAIKEKQVDMIDYVPPRHLERVKEIPGVRLMEYTLPRVHLLQFNLNRVELRKFRELRRAIDVGIDRSAIMKTVNIAEDQKNRIITGPLPYGSFGYNKEVQSRGYDPLQARLLIASLKKQTNQVPTLRLAHAGNESTLKACQEIVKQLAKVGLQVSLVDLDAGDPTNPIEADMRYQILTVSDPIYDMITLVTRDNPSLALNATPWLRERLVELMQLPTRSAAEKVLPAFHKTLHDDVALVTLWQWHDHFAVAETVSGLSEAPPSLYFGIPDWTAKPKFPNPIWVTR